MLLYVFFAFFWCWMKHDPEPCVVLCGQERYLIIGQHSPQGKRRVVGSSFHELQMAPELLTTGRRLQRPETYSSMWHAAAGAHGDTSLQQRETRICERILPQIELIRAVGLKLSTKSDIRLPNSCKEAHLVSLTDNKSTAALQQSAYIRSLRSVTQCESAPSGYSFLISVTAKYAGSRHALRSRMYSTTFTQEN